MTPQAHNISAVASDLRDSAAAAAETLARREREIVRIAQRVGNADETKIERMLAEAVIDGYWSECDVFGCDESRSTFRDETFSAPFGDGHAIGGWRGMACRDCGEPIDNV